jgi:hypothetical protein
LNSSKFNVLKKKNKKVGGERERGREEERERRGERETRETDRLELEPN